MTTATYNAANQLVSSGATTFSYDPNGNLAAQSGGNAFTYNAADQTVSIDPPGTSPAVVLAYAGAGQSERTRAGETTFLTGFLGLSKAGADTYSRDPSGNLVSQRSGGGAKHYYLFDALGSVIALTDASGAVVNRYAYDPWGNRAAGTVEAVANPFEFASGYRDDFSGYTKFGTRYYDPATGRWTQPDPSGLDANAYLYTGANPVNFVDPSGLFGLDDVFGVFDIAGALEDLANEEPGVRDVLDDLAGAAGGLTVAVACEFVAGLLALPTAGIAGVATSGVCVTLSVAAGEIIQDFVGDE